MIILNNKKYAANKKEFTESLFTDTPCVGFYKKLKKGIRLSDHQEEVFAFIFDNGITDRGIVSCRKQGKGYRYQYAVMATDEKRLGFENGMRYSEGVRMVEKVLDELCPNKYLTYF